VRTTLTFEVLDRLSAAVSAATDGLGLTRRWTTSDADDGGGLSSQLIDSACPLLARAVAMRLPETVLFFLSIREGLVKTEKVINHRLGVNYFPRVPIVDTLEIMARVS